ncbi:MAG: hypothetical protein H0V16_10145 [Burkholderiaceae bacterium]|nr:hypothetical protein [Burkholderiaceae bacterium]
MVKKFFENKEALVEAAEKLSNEMGRATSSLSGTKDRTIPFTVRRAAALAHYSTDLTNAIAKRALDLFQQDENRWVMSHCKHQKAIEAQEHVTRDLTARIERQNQVISALAKEVAALSRKAGK